MHRKYIWIMARIFFCRGEPISPYGNSIFIIIVKVFEKKRRMRLDIDAVFFVQNVPLKVQSIPAVLIRKTIFVIMHYIRR